MLVMRTIEDTTNPVGELVSAKQTLGLDHFALAVYPLGFYDVKPRTLLGQMAAYDPHSTATVLDSAVMLAEPASDLLGDMPIGVVSDEEQHLLACRLKLFATPPMEELRRYRVHGPAVDESQPGLVDFGQVGFVAEDGLRLEVVFSDRLLDEAKGFSFLSLTSELIFHAR